MLKSAEKIHAIDIGSKSIKVVEIKTGSPPIILKKDSLDIYLTPQENPNSSTSLQMSKSALNHLLRKMHISPKQMKQVYTTLSGEQYAVKQIRIDKMSPNELQSFLKYEARKHLPTKDEILFDYELVREFDTQMDIILVTTSRTDVQRHIRLLAECGIKDPVVDIPPLALLNACLLDTAYNPTRDIRLLLNIGANFSQVVIFQSGGLFFAKEIHVAGNQFTKALAKDNQMDFEKAEILKLNQGMFSSSDGAHFNLHSKSLVNRLHHDHCLHKLVKEVQQAIRSYLKETNQEAIHHYMVTGGCANDPLLSQYLSESLNHSVTPFTPEAYNYRMNASEGSNFHYTLALGLALRGNFEDHSY